MLPGQFGGLDLSKLHLFDSRVNIFELTFFQSRISLGVSVKMTLRMYSEPVSTETTVSPYSMSDPERKCV